MTGRASGERDDGLAGHRVDASHVPAVLGLDRPDDRTDRGVEDRILERAGEFASMDVAQVAASRPAACIGRSGLGKRVPIVTGRDAGDQALRRCLVSHQDVAHPARGPTPKPVAVPDVVRTDVALGNGCGGRDELDEPGHRVRRQ